MLSIGKMARTPQLRKGMIVSTVPITRMLSTSVCVQSAIDYSSESYQYLHRSRMPTMHFQKSLLRLPIPELDKTMSRYLLSQKPILTEDEYASTEKAVKEFRNGAGPTLHAQLKVNDKNNKHTSYISGPWFDMYLRDRAPLVLNYNPFMVLLPETRPGYSDPVIRTSNILVSSARFINTLRKQILEPEVFHLNPSKSDTTTFRRLAAWTPSALASYIAYAHKAFPLDMSQFSSLFNSTRVPEYGKDRLKANPEAKHMLLMKNGNFYVFDIFDKDGNVLSPMHIHACVSYVAKDPTPRPSHPIGIFTSENRDTWASARQDLLQLGNEEVLHAIDTAAFNIVLEEAEVGMDPEKGYRTFLYGDASNRWFDKSFSLIVTSDGMVALNFEHAWGDGVAVMRYFNEVSKDSVENSHIHPDSQLTNIDASQYVRRLDFKMNSKVEEAVQSAENSFNRMTSKLAFNYLESDVFGKTFCKKHKISPDAAMQLGFQVAYYLQNGKTVATYESCSTSAFKHGRTETVRPATIETMEFCKAVASKDPPSPAALKQMISKCSEKHGELTKNAALGQGFDRHLFAMLKLAEKQGGSLPPLYTDPAYTKINHNILSTSTLPSPFISFGGFGPVVKDGFGIGYQIQEDKLGIVLSSYPPHRDGTGFIECAEKAYRMIHDSLAKAV